MKIVRLQCVRSPHPLHLLHSDRHLSFRRASSMIGRSRVARCQPGFLQFPHFIVRASSEDESPADSIDGAVPFDITDDEEEEEEEEQTFDIITDEPSIFESKEVKSSKRNISKSEKIANARYEKLILTGGDYDDLDAEWEALNRRLEPIRESYYDGSAYNNLELPPTPMKTLEDFPYEPLPSFQMSLAQLFEEAQLTKEATEIKRNFGEVLVTGMQSVGALVKPGDLYFAHKSPYRDGLKEILTALENGAVGVILPQDADADFPSKLPDGSDKKIPFIAVKSINGIMGRLGCIFYRYPSSKLKMISVAGSRGKSSVAWILRRILLEFGVHTGMVSDIEYAIDDDRLTEQGELFIPTEEDPSYHRQAATPYHLLPFKGKYRVEQTVPDPLQMQKVLAGMAYRGAEACVVECPVEAIYDLRLLNVDFDLSIFLNLSSDPSESAESFQAMKTITGRLFSKLDIPEGQRAIVNIDDEHAQYFLDQSSEVPVVTYSLSDPMADVWVESINKTIWESELVIGTPLGRIQIITPLIGENHIYNILAATAAAISMDVELQDIVTGIEALDFVPGRCEVVDEGQEFSVVVDNAHTPERLRSVIKDVRACGPKRVFLVFGCSYFHSKEMRAEMGSVAYYEADIVLVTTDSPGYQGPDEVIADIIAGFPKDLLQKSELWVMNPWQDPGRVPWWFEQWLFRAQSEVQRHVVEDRGIAIRGAIGTARKGDVVIIAGRGNRDYSLWLNRDNEEFWTWFDDKREVLDALFKLPHLIKSQINTDKLPWVSPKETTDRKRKL